MVNEGLLAEDSPWGIWEITDKGRKFYEENKQSW
jgi:predicted transcriptional regulator